MKLCLKCGEENLNSTNVCIRCYSFLDSQKAKAIDRKLESRYEHFSFAAQETPVNPLNRIIGHWLGDFKFKLHNQK